MRALPVAAQLFLQASVFAALTNGTGGGSWAVQQTWAKSAPPTVAETVSVQPGDLLTVPTGESFRCGALKIEGGGRLVVDPGGTLTCAGDVDVLGTLSLGSESRLEIDCPQNMQYGIHVGAGGGFFAHGSHGFEPNCVIRAAKRDGKHNTYMRVDRDGRLFLRVCEVSHMGGAWAKEVKTRAGRNQGIDTWAPPEVVGCVFHHCEAALQVSAAGNLTVEHNRFEDNHIGLTVFRSRNVIVRGNSFGRNRSGMSVSCARWEGSVEATDNVFLRNDVGLSAHGPLAQSAFHGNLYLENRVGLLMASANVPVAEECFVGNEYGVELSKGIVGAALTRCVFGEFQGRSLPNRKADVLVDAPGPAGLTLNGCRLGAASPVVFAPPEKGQEVGNRWVASQNHNQIAGRTERWSDKEAQSGAVK